MTATGPCAFRLADGTICGQPRHCDAHAAIGSGHGNPTDAYHDYTRMTMPRPDAAAATPVSDAPTREVVLPDLRLHGNLPVVVRRCYYNGSDVVPTTDPADGLALRYRYACDPPEWYRLTERDMARCSGDDFRALAKLEAAHV